MAKLFCKSCGAENDGTINKLFLKNPCEVFDRGNVIDLARAVRSGDREEAEYQLARLIGDDDEIAEWISQGRALA